jgi:hypothetical protein
MTQFAKIEFILSRRDSSQKADFEREGKGNATWELEK